MGTDFLDDAGHQIPVEFDKERSLISLMVSKFLTPVKAFGPDR